MISFINADELFRVAGNFITKGIMVRHPNELVEIEDGILMSQDARYISELYKKVQAEMAANLAGGALHQSKSEYLRQLYNLFSTGPLGEWFAQVEQLRNELYREVVFTNPVVVRNADGVLTTAVFQVQAQCLIAAEKFDSFSPEQRKRLGELYLIATNGDTFIRAILHEIDRQQQLFAVISISGPKNASDSISSENTDLQEIFSLRFTVEHCNKLMRAVQVGTGFKNPTPSQLQAKIWALLYVLSDENHKLLTCKPIAAAQIVGNHYNCSMPERPWKVKEGGTYKEAYKKLQDAVKEDIKAKKYGA
jgi:hypothetical protein